MPHLARHGATLNFRGGWKRDTLAELLGLRPKTEDRIDDLLNRTLLECGISSDDSPLTYFLDVSNFDNAMQFCEDDLPEADRVNYLGLFFVSDTFTVDYGEELETVELHHPGLGSWLLRLLDQSPCNILTPLRLYADAELLLQWTWSNKDRKYHYAGDADDDAITPERFMEYYPEWAYTDHSDDPPPDLTPWPQLIDLERLSGEFRESVRACDARQLLIPNGADMYCGVIAWTRGRCEVENDLACRCGDDLHQQLAYSFGVAPGCVQFEFVLDDANAARNRRIAELLKCFCRYLAALDDVMDNIEEGAFR